MIDVIDPMNPQIVASVDTPLGSYALDVTVVGRCAYLVGSVSGLIIIDIADPVHPAIVGSLSTSNTWKVAVVGNYAYVIDGFLGFTVMDISNPALPWIVRSIDVKGQDLVVSGNYAYLPQEAAGLAVVDISDPLNAHYVTNLPFTGGSATRVAVANNKAYIVSESATANRLLVANVANPQAMSIVGNVLVPGLAAAST